MQDNEVHIQIWDANGNKVVDEVRKAQTATQEQIDEMVMMIESGTPAWVASTLAKQEQPK